MIFRGVKLQKPIVVPFTGSTRNQLLFDNSLDHETRERWSQAGFPVFWDSIAAKYYVFVTISDMREETPQENPCVCGSRAVGSSKHSYYCGA